MKLKNILILTFLQLCMISFATETSNVGFYPLTGSGRQVYNFNPSWRFYKGDVKDAEKKRISMIRLGK